jgi:hypothetical protein
MIALFGIEINWWHGFSDLISITVAYLLALPIGWHRLKGQRAIGLRTYPLVPAVAIGGVAGCLKFQRMVEPGGSFNKLPAEQ